MGSETTIICKLGGNVGSDTKILSLYPELEIPSKETSKLISKCFPIGSKVGHSIINKYEKRIILSYIFKIKKEDKRDDLLSFSIIMDRKLKSEIYKQIFWKAINFLKDNHQLTEEWLVENHKSIYEKIKFEFDKQKVKIKGSFF